MDNDAGGDFANLGAGGAATLSVMAADGGYTGDGGRLIIPLDERYLELTVQLEAAQIAFAGLSLMTEVLKKRLFHKDLTGQISLDQAMFKRQTIVNR